MIISETGTLAGRENAMGAWLNTKNMSSYLVRYMNHADKIDLVSLWLIPYTWWSPNRHLFIKNDKGKLVLQDDVGYFLELWKDYSGDRLPNRLDTADTNVHLHSVIDGKVVWVAINNLNPYRISVDLSLLTGASEIRRIEQMQLYFDHGRNVFKTVKRKSLRGLPVHVEETTLVKIILYREPEPQAVLNETIFYGDMTLQPTGAPVTFKVACREEELVAARLRICLSRNGGFGENLTLRVNGQTVIADRVITPARKAGNYWGYLAVDVPPDLIAKSNDVIVSIPEQGGTITSIALIAITEESNQ
jgi:agarase